KPTDLVVDHDGSLFVADWADGQRPRRGRGRIYHVRYVGKSGESPEEKTPRPDRLDAESSLERCRAQEALERRGQKGLAEVVAALEPKRLGVRGRLHAVWAVAKVAGPEAAERLFALAQSDPDPRVQAQAVRALADLMDPVLVRHRLDAGPGDPAFAARLAAVAGGRDPRVQLEVILALGRLRWSDAPAWLRRNLKQPDAALAHAAQWTLRRAGNWPAVLQLLDEPNTEPFRTIARRAVADQYNPQVVEGLLERLRRETDSSRRREYADALTRVYKKPATPWTYWGFRPPPRPAHSVAWERTEAIAQALEGVLADPDRNVRLDVLRHMLREKVPTRVSALGRWLQEEHQADRAAILLQALKEGPTGEARPHLERVLRDRGHTTANRLLAVSLFLRGPEAPGGDGLLATAEAVEDGPILAELLRALGQRRDL